MLDQIEWCPYDYTVGFHSFQELVFLGTNDSVEQIHNATVPSAG